MPPAHDPDVGSFAASPCADFAEQKRQLRALAGDAWFLELDPIWARGSAQGAQPWLFQASVDGGHVGVATGIVREGRMQRGLHVSLARPLEDAALAVWTGLRRFAEEHSIAAVSVASFGEARPEIPHLPGETARDRTVTMLIDLAGHTPRALSKGHRWCIGKARKAGVELLAQPVAKAIRDHTMMCQQSFARRRSRGEIITARSNEAMIELFLASGLAALMQAGLAGRVVSSHLILEVDGAAYYFSSGTSPEGMEVGASHFLMSETIRRVQASGCRTLNLGFSKDEGLIRFKAGFGAQPFAVETATAGPRGAARRWVRRILDALR